MRLVVLESPYAGDVDANVEYARACVRDALQRGDAPIASHLLYTQPGILRDEVPAEREATRLTEREMAALKREAEKEERSVMYIAARAIRQYLAGREKKS
jgi:hypothetical protein